MNKIKFLTVFCITTLLLLFTACKKDCKKENCKEEDDPCKIDRPKDVKPIDWENYNSVYDVYWNYYALTCEVNKKIDEDEGKDIMLYGWIFQGVMDYTFDGYKFILIGNEEDIFSWNSSILSSGICVWSSGIRDSLIDKFNTNDVTKKCFVKGNLSCYSRARYISPEIIMVDINDIYFE